ncbi:MAG TPA: M15 family metallopeptidase, partial [Acidimicrobiales bacterium]|nr:M15 family metallopeptidase [Acidimicrobiales bacterium]
VPAPDGRPSPGDLAPTGPDADGTAPSPGDAPTTGGAREDGREGPGKGGKAGKGAKSGKAGKAEPGASGEGGDRAVDAEGEEQALGSGGPMLATSRPADDDGAAAGRGPRVGRPMAEAIVLAAQVSHVEAVADRTAAAAAAVDERLRSQIERRAAHLFALDRTRTHAGRMDRHLDYLYNELHAARAGMRAAGRWLAEAERGRADVPTVKVKDFRVHSSVASSLRDLLRAAFADGILLTDASSYRSIDSQIELRKQNCGPTPYDVFERPSGTCSPPTARPGRSLHESGLAIDFQHDGQSIVSRSSPAYRWLAANAPSYGFFNLPSEPWHWSVSGY